MNDSKEKETEEIYPGEGHEYLNADKIGWITPALLILILIIMTCHMREDVLFILLEFLLISCLAAVCIYLANKD